MARGHKHPYVMRQPDGSVRCPECGEAVVPQPAEPRPRRRKYKGTLEFRERPLSSGLARPGPGENHVLLSAHHPEYGPVGHLSFTRHGGDNPDHLSIRGITVDRDHVRRGIATALMAELESRHPGVPIDHGDRSYTGMLWAHRYYKTPRFRMNPDHPDDYPGGWTIDKTVVSRDEARAEIARRRTERTAPGTETDNHASDERMAAAGDDAFLLGLLYHSTPYPHGFPYDDWMHLGTRAAAESRARSINPEDYGLPGDSPVTMHTVRLHGRVYPHILTDEQATMLTGNPYPIRDIDDGLPSGAGYTVFPYRNDGEDAGTISYLAHHSAIDRVKTETLPRDRFSLKTAAAGPWLEA